MAIGSIIVKAPSPCSREGGHRASWDLAGSVVGLPCASMPQRGSIPGLATQLDLARAAALVAKSNTYGGAPVRGQPNAISWSQTARGASGDQAWDCTPARPAMSVGRSISATGRKVTQRLIAIAASPERAYPPAAVASKASGDNRRLVHAQSPTPGRAFGSPNRRPAAVTTPGAVQAVAGAYRSPTPSGQRATLAWRTGAEINGARRSLFR